jgi:hypothetical protein
MSEDAFRPDEIDLLDRAFRAAPSDAPWLGWASAGTEPTEILILRRRLELRRLRLVKRQGTLCLLDEDDRLLWRGGGIAAFVDEAALRPTAFEVIAPIRPD